MIGTVLGVPFLAFAITIAVSSPLLDIIGMGLLLPLAAVLVPAGMLLMGFAGELANSGDGVYHLLWAGAAIAGVAMVAGLALPSATLGATATVPNGLTTWYLGMPGPGGTVTAA